MVDETESRVRRAFARVVPSPAAGADLADALATAERAAATPARRSLWIGVAAAAVLIAAVGIVAVRREPVDGREAKKIVASALDGRTVRVRIDASGWVELDDLDGTPRARVELGGTPARASDGLDALERALVEITARVPRDLNGLSPVALELVPSKQARWRWIQWTMQAAAHPKVLMVTMRFGAEGSDETPFEQRLPVDLAMEPTDESPPVGVAVIVQVSEKGGARIRLAGTESPWTVDFDSSLAPIESRPVELSRAMSELSSSLRTAAAGERNGVFGDIEVPTPSGDGVTYELVHEVLRAFREAGIDDVRFNGAARPKPQEGTSSR